MKKTGLYFLVLFLIFSLSASENFGSRCSQHFTRVFEQLQTQKTSPQVDSVLQCVRGDKSDQAVISEIWDGVDTQAPKVYQARLDAVKKFGKFLQKIKNRKRTVTARELAHDFSDADCKHARYLLEDNGCFVQAAVCLMNV